MRIIVDSAGRTILFSLGVAPIPNIKHPIGYSESKVGMHLVHQMDWSRWHGRNLETHSICGLGININTSTVH